MKHSFNDLVNKNEHVFILRFKKMNKYILDSNIDYALCAVGVHPNGRIQVVENRKSCFAVSENDRIPNEAIHDGSLGRYLKLIRKERKSKNAQILNILKA